MLNIFRRSFTALCGHVSPRVGKVHVQGKSFSVSLPLTTKKTLDYCLACVELASIRCAWCGGIILPGHAVTNMGPGTHEQTPSFATHYPLGQSSVIGCLRWKCAWMSGGPDGFWIVDSHGNGTLDPISNYLDALDSSHVH